MEAKDFTKHLKSKRWYLDHLMDLGCKEATQFGPFGKKDYPVETICYGDRDRWNSRFVAMEFFRMGMIMCDGCEADRYMRIYLDLYAGKKVGSDGDPERKRKTQ